MEYRVQQKATIWYETKIEADSPEQAIEKIQNPETNLDLDWWQVLDTTEFQDVFWWQDTDENEGTIPDV
jgi:hypothetical protein